MHVLSLQTRSHSRVWSCYVDLMTYAEYDKPPLELHQAVLRRCVPSPAALRTWTASRMQRGQALRAPHLYEGRLKTVMRNIRAAGVEATLQDYHVILEQFAAVGHYTGSMHVFTELTHVCKLEPEPKTFGLCFKAIAHRLSLPMYKAQRADIVADTSKLCRKLLKEMSARNIPCTSFNLDLVIRIFKEVLDQEGFSQLMKLGYGIDLDYPDHPPLQGSSTLSPFSTPALNTTLDMLGRLGNVAKLVQTFEVLTQPLPPQASQHYSHEFDDEDDFGIANPASTEPYKAPHAQPNTTSYNILLRHISRAGHATFARHYLFQATRLDRQVDRRLRSQLYHNPHATPAPHFGINRGTIIPVFGEANRDKNMELMRWVGWVARMTIRRKKNDIAFYCEQRDSMSAPVSPSEPAPSDSRGAPPPDITTALDVDLDAPSAPPDSPTPEKLFNINLHLRILEKNLDELVSWYENHYEVALSRATQRVKERLGRRVWAGKNIYLLSDNARITIPRKAWTGIVNFKPGKTRASNNGRVLRSGWVAGYKGLRAPRLQPLQFFDPS
ncbi:hypothetical protein K503DRAFT_768391 [Rhizopogon vinicolor AM-OR11-026]|uniref:Uncharacterized protein n=1 Tax=Rhizopogon vinicolor AM-OR11-026 TaxID=1314800 RepID=A0A1B7N757_9AGAM|nr:hypothetical protein K503DRAFT_768391 [Rhizopogon vinicolor AM-OR11-026]